MLIGGIAKTTLLDYPGKVACVLFTNGCNFRCPFCHNPELLCVSTGNEMPRIETEEVLRFLKDRIGLLEGVVVTGGEPILQSDLGEFLDKIKSLGFSVKLDTNGSDSSRLENILQQNLVDYVAMDIKAPLAKYTEVANANIKTDDIRKSVEMLLASNVEYEFRTTVVPEFHSKSDLAEIGKLIKGAKQYYIQNFRPGKTLDPSLSKSFSNKELIEFKNSIAPYVKNVSIRT